MFDGVRVHQRRPLENLKSCEYHIRTVDAASLLKLMCALIVCDNKETRHDSIIIKIITFTILLIFYVSLE